MFQWLTLNLSIYLLHPAATSSPVLCRPLDAAAEVVMICIFVDFHASGVAWTAPADAPPPGLSASHVVGVQAGA